MAAYYEGSGILRGSEVALKGDREQSARRDRDCLRYAWLLTVRLPVIGRQCRECSLDTSEQDTVLLALIDWDSLVDRCERLCDGVDCLLASRLPEYCGCDAKLSWSSADKIANPFDRFASGCQRTITLLAWARQSFQRDVDDLDRQGGNPPRYLARVDEHTSNCLLARCLGLRDQLFACGPERWTLLRHRTGRKITKCVDQAWKVPG